MHNNRITFGQNRRGQPRTESPQSERSSTENKHKVMHRRLDYQDEESEQEDLEEPAA